MSTTPVRLPVWLSAPTAALVILAFIRIDQAQGSAGVSGLAQILVSAAFVLACLWIVDRREMRGEPRAAKIPSGNLRKKLFLALIIVTDLYLLIIVLFVPRVT
jgi:hypothetical protein